MTGKIITLELSEHQERQLNFLLSELKNDKYSDMETIEEIVSYVIERIANGTKSAKNWERKIVYFLGLLQDPKEEVDHG